MDSRRLSQRKKQPGHDQTFRKSESNFITAARQCLDPSRYEVDPKPRDLAECFPSRGVGRDLGLAPEAKISSKETGRIFFVEVKKQGPRGNADERACRHHTKRFYDLMHDTYGYEYHPYVTIFCEALAELPRYTIKAQYIFEPDQYFLWKDYDLDALCRYLRARCSDWLDP